MLSDYGWQVKTWRLKDKQKMLDWMKKHEGKFMIRQIFVNNELAIEYKRRIIVQ